MTSHTTQPVTRVAIVGLATVHDRMPTVPESPHSFAFDRLGLRVTLIKQVMPQKQPRANRRAHDPRFTAGPRFQPTVHLVSRLPSRRLTLRTDFWSQWRKDVLTHTVFGPPQLRELRRPVCGPLFQEQDILSRHRQTRPGFVSSWVLLGGRGCSLAPLDNRSDDTAVCLVRPHAERFAMQLAGRTVLITGGRRVGGQLAREVARRGAHVAMTWFSQRAPVDRTIEDVRSLGAKGLAFQADLRRPSEAEAFVAAAASAFGTVDVLVNMASIFEPRPFDDLSPADFDDNIAANLAAPYHTAVAAARQMRRQPVVDGLQGKIINFTDWAVERPYRNFLPYFVAKGGLSAMTVALAVELAPTITVNSIAPAMIDPPPGLSAEEIETIRQASPLKRIGTPADAVQLALFLLEGSDFATGATYRLDGGRFLGATPDAGE